MPILFVVKPVDSSISAPSAPEFTATITDSSEYVPTVYYLDHSTGKIVADEAYIAIAKTIRLTIENQPFTPYHDYDSDRDIKFCYNMRIKGHNSGTWSLVHGASELPSPNQDSQYMKSSITLKTARTTTYTIFGGQTISLADGAQIDVQVAAMI